MIRRNFLRKSLIAALALVMAAAPSIAQADAYGTLRTSPYQFKNWLGYDLHDVTVTHYYGLTSETFDLGTVYSGQAAMGNTVHFYTGGAIYAGDYWTITGWYKSNNGVDYHIWRSLDHYDLHSIDAGVMVTMDMVHGAFSYATLDDLKVDYYSNNGSWTGLSVYEIIGN